MDLSGNKEEVYLYNTTALPGHLYNKITKKCFPRDDGKFFNICECSDRYSVDHFNMDGVKNLIKISSKIRPTWMKDFEAEDPVDAILIKGTKILEKAANNFTKHDIHHTITSTLHKGFVYMLLTFSKEVQVSLINKLLNYINAVINGSSGDSFPARIFAFSKFTFIYDKFNTKTDDRSKIDTSKHAVDEFCRILKDSKLSTIPLACYLAEPISSNVNEICDRNLPQLSSDKTSEVFVNGKANVTIVHRNSYDGNADSGQAENKQLASRGQEICREPLLNIDKFTNTSMEPKSNAYVGNKLSISEVNYHVAEDLKSKCSDIPTENIDRPIKELDHAEFPCDNAEGTNPSQIRKLKVDADKNLQDNNTFSFDGHGNDTGVQMIIENEIAEECRSNLNETPNEKLNAKEKHSHACKIVPSSNEYIVNVTSIDGKNNDIKIHVDVEKKVNVKCRINSSGNPDKTLKVKEKHSQECRRAPSSPVSTVKDESYSGGKIQKKETQSQSKEMNNIHPISNYSEDQINLPSSKVKQGKLNEVENVSCPVKSPEGNTVSQQCKAEDEQMNFLHPVKTITDSCGIERKYYGQINESLPEKVILLLGASGCGKTTLLNFIANFCKGKETADEGLVNVATMVAPTSLITAYTFCTAENENPITIVDTPGLNDSCGAEIRDHVQSLKIFIANASSKGFKIHAIGFVAQAHLVRLTSSERLVMDYVSTMFGERVSDHLITFVTFADSQNTPPIIEAMNDYGVSFKQFFRFNNSALSNWKSDEVDDLDRVYWKICRKQWKKCLKIVKELPCLSVKAMKAVQSEVFASTVIESTENSLNAEMCTFLKQCHKENGISREMEKVCKQIWQLAAVLQKLKNDKEPLSLSVENVLINYAVGVCKALSLSPENMVGYLSLIPSGMLVEAGSEVILTMEPIYKWSKTLQASFESLTKFEWAYCYSCESDHKLERIKNKKSIRKYISALLSDQSESIICLKCQKCSCSADLHCVSTMKSPISDRKILEHTQKRLSEVFQRYSFPGYPASKESYSNCISERLGSNYFEFIRDIFNVGWKM